MKNIFTFLAVVFFTSNAFAYQTKLSVSSLTTASLRLEIDGKKYWLNNTSRYDNSIVLDEISVGMHKVVLYKLQTKKRGSRNMYDNGQVIYQGNVIIKNMYYTDITISRFGKVYIDEMYYRNVQNETVDISDNQAMESNSFNELKQLINKEAFDKSKFNTLKSASEYNNFSTDQVKELMQVFSFDSGKLDVAKLLFNRVIDKQNYYLLSEQFIFTNTKDEFKEYIQKH